LTLAVPNVETTRAAANVELPIGATLLIGGLPAKSKDGIPHQLVVLIRADRMRPIRMKNNSKLSSEEAERQTAAVVTEPAPAPKQPAALRTRPAQTKRNPFSLISRILNRVPRQDAVPEDSAARPE
jgi:hypothetical protein